MNSERWQWLPIALAVSGTAIVWSCAIANLADLGPWIWGLLLGSSLPLVAAWWFRRVTSPREEELDQLERELTEQRKDVSSEQQQLTSLRQSIEAELAGQAKAIDRREQTLMKKLATWHEWMEYPEPIDLTTPDPRSPAQHEADLTSLVEKDRQLMKLLEAESELFFNKIQANQYNVEGTFCPQLLLNDGYVLVQKVAKVYRPEIDNPLTDASLEDLTRAASRACLHFLVVLEQLPIQVQQYNIRKMYGWINQAVKAYGVYQSARPYLPYLNSAYYLTRFALGANPFSLLAWWLASEVASRSASAVTQKIVNQRALAVMHDVVRVIGFEVASIYGGHLRHRDANWIYAAELSELVSRFPMSRDSLIHALNEVGSVQLLNEYDRIFLYRCLALQRSAEPGKYLADVALVARERQAIATRLERFFHTYIHGKTEKKVRSWQRGVEERLSVKLTLDASSPALNRQEQTIEAVRSLASFLVAVKEHEGDQLQVLLADSTCLAEIPQPRRDELLNELAAEPPFFFEQPNLEPDSPTAVNYLNELVKLAVETPPLDMPIEPLLVDVGAWLRKNESQIHAMIGEAYQRLLRRRNPELNGSLVTTSAAKAIVQIMPEDADVTFAYDKVKIEWRPPHDQQERTSGEQYCLVAADNELLLLACDLPASLVWNGSAQNVRLEKSAGLLGSEVKLTGGIWLSNPEGDSPDLRLTAGALTRSDKHFGPLCAFFSRSLPE